MSDNCMYPEDPDGQNQVRCTLCNIWHHCECVKEDDSGMVWTCPSCSGMVSLMRSMQADLKLLKDNFDDINETLTAAKTTNHDLFDVLTEIKEELRKEQATRATREEEIERLRSQIRDLSDEIRILTNQKKAHSDQSPSKHQTSKASYASATSTKTTGLPSPPLPPTEPTKTLLIGTSLLRNINPEKLVNCDLIAKGGAKVDDLSQIIASMPDSREYKEVILVAGSVDLESGSQADVINAFKAFTVCALDKAKKVRISSVIPRADTHIKARIDPLNVELKNMCNADQHEFVDNDPFFHVMSGEINKALLLEDGLHLSQAGVECLIRNLGLITKGSPFSTKRYAKRPNRTLFKGYDHPLSNFFPVNGLRISGKVFHTSEAAYQFEKAKMAGNETAAKKIEACRTGIQAMRLGSNVKAPEEWQTHKIKVMERVIQAKLTVCKEARDALLNSGTSEIVEDTSHPFWACGLDGNGQNMMGKILMTYRRKLREDPGQFQTRPYSAPDSRKWATRNQQPRCYRCGEAGHGQNQCGHREEVFCWGCGLQGHKQKMCHNFSQRDHHSYV